MANTARSHYIRFENPIVFLTCMSTGKFQKISDNEEHVHFVACAGCLHYGKKNALVMNIRTRVSEDATEKINE